MARPRQEIKNDELHMESKELLHLILEVLLDIRDAMPVYEPEE